MNWNLNRDCRSPEDAVRAENAERKLGWRAEALVPHLAHGVFIWFGGRRARVVEKL
jgi:hypothetical protein